MICAGSLYLVGEVLAEVEREGKNVSHFQEELKKFEPSIRLLNLTAGGAER